MHELAYTQNILDTSIRRANEAKAKQITNIYLVIGQFSSIEDDMVQYYWDTITTGTIAEGSRLHFEHVPGKITCMNCTYSFQPDVVTFECPNCSSGLVRITQGDEFRIDSIDVE
jgi:hydrogenase nickel incorporation protein HypA/HybF